MAIQLPRMFSTGGTKHRMLLIEEPPRSAVFPYGFSIHSAPSFLSNPKVCSKKVHIPCLEVELLNMVNLACLVPPVLNMADPLFLIKKRGLY